MVLRLPWSMKWVRFLLHLDRTTIHELYFADPRERRRGSLGKPRAIPDVDVERDQVGYHVFIDVLVYSLLAR